MGLGNFLNVYVQIPKSAFWSLSVPGSNDQQTGTAKLLSVSTKEQMPHRKCLLQVKKLI